jgi:SWI/SNF-related matrix-associated actin-dependent regulator 1 of chromatin subfamily A
MEIRFEIIDDRFCSVLSSRVRSLLAEKVGFESWDGEQYVAPFELEMVKSLMEQGLLKNRLSPVFLKLLQVCANYYAEFPMSSLSQRIQEANEPLDVPGFQGTLLPHQNRAVRSILRVCREICIMCLGSGKTVVSIAAMLMLRSQQENSKPILVVCPAGLRSNWQAEIKTFSTLRCLVLSSTKKAPLELSKTDVDVFLVSLDLVHPIRKILVKKKFEIIITDEAHLAKNPCSLRGKALLKIATKCTQRLVLLTGTPSQKHQSIWHLLKMVNPDLFAHFHHNNVYVSTPPPPDEKIFYFAERYCVPELIRVSNSRKQYNFNTNQRSGELRAILRPFVLRMSSEEVLNLPPLTREHIVIGDLSSKKKIYYQNEMNKIELARETKGSLFADAILMELLRETCRTKLKYLLPYITMTLELTDTKKFILFYHHRIIGDAIKNHLEKSNVGHIMINGDTSMVSRAPMLSRFKEDPLCRVGILSMGACSTGLNLQFVSLSMFAELTFNAIAMRQSEGRTYRTGQKEHVVQQYLILQGSTDHLVWKSLQKKVKTQSCLLDASTEKLDHSVVVKKQRTL